MRLRVTVLLLIRITASHRSVFSMQFSSALSILYSKLLETPRKRNLMAVGLSQLGSLRSTLNPGH